MAYEWYEKALVAGSVFGMAKVGQLLVCGCGVERDTTMGMARLCSVEDRGSAFAAFIMGYYMAEGLYGVRVDKGMARELLEKCLSSGSCSDLTVVQKEQLAQRKLNELWNHQEGTSD